MPTKAKQLALDRGEYLDGHLFVKALGILALNAKAFQKDPGPVAMLLHFMEKITQSQGIAKVKKTLGRAR